MTFPPTVIRAEYCGEYRIRLVFNNGLDNTVDFSQWLEDPILEPLKDTVTFSATSSREGRLRGPTVPTWRPKPSTSDRDRARPPNPTLQLAALRRQ